MKAWTEKDIENLINNSTFPNHAHKSALLRQLAASDAALDLDDLDKVAGGKTVSEEEKWTPWPDSGQDEP